MSKEVFVIAIDGPAGSGKSTVSQILADRLQLKFLTTGAFYRGLAYLCQKKDVIIENVEDVVSYAKDKGFKVVANVAGTKVFIDGLDVTDELSKENVARVASQISAYPQVRSALLESQRAFETPPGLIAEGRDCGTVVFPHANVKIFLTASLDKRAQRRSQDEKGIKSSDLAQNLARRDRADTDRKVAPMAKAADAVEIDSSALSATEVVDKIMAIVKARWKK